MREGAPVRFLLLVLAGWTGLRVATFSADWWRAEPTAEAAPPLRPGSAAAQAVAVSGPMGAATEEAIQPSLLTATMPIPQRLMLMRRRLAMAPSSFDSAPSAAAIQAERVPAPSDTRTPAAIPLRLEASGAAASPPLHSQRPSRRWSGSAWVLARRDGDPALAPGGTLGGSQAGARLLYRLNGDAARPITLSARTYVPLRRAAGAEAALGLDWQPSARFPVHLLVERRQRLGPEGRSAFAATLYGGASAQLGPRWRLDGYGQAGIVGTRTRDAFVDGAARLSRRIGPIEAGGAIWGAAQPGAARLDAGPLLTLPLRTRVTTLRLSAEYRFRVAGDARPSSGPALTLGVDF